MEPEGDLPLSTLLSHVLVAITISLDNEFEHRMPHRTTLGVKRGERTEGPWLVSWPMWANFMRFLPPEGMRVADFRQLPGVGEQALGGKNPGMVRWGYVTLDAPGSTKARLHDQIVRPTQAGLGAQDVWRTLLPVVQATWAAAFGPRILDHLCDSLRAVMERADVDSELPHYIDDVLRLFGRPRPSASPRVTKVEELDLVALLSQVLSVFVEDYEKRADSWIVMAANVLRVVDPAGTPARDLPRRAGISKEAMNLMTGPLWHGQFVTIDTDPATPRAKMARLTGAGEQAKRAYERVPALVEKDWRRRFGAATITELRETLEILVVSPMLAGSPLAKVIQPYPDGWRSWQAPPMTLPHHPQPNHRGGYPDGA